MDMSIEVQAIALSTEQRTVLENWACAATVPQRAVVRARIILMAAQGVPNGCISKTLGISQPKVAATCRQFSSEGLAALNLVPSQGGRKRWLWT